jgi:hypothetical protein
MVRLFKTHYCFRKNNNNLSINRPAAYVRVAVYRRPVCKNWVVAIAPPVSNAIKGPATKFTSVQDAERRLAMFGAGFFYGTFKTQPGFKVPVYQLGGIL